MCVCRLTAEAFDTFVVVVGTGFTRFGACLVGWFSSKVTPAFIEQITFSMLYIHDII